MDVKGIISEKESFGFGNEVSFCLKYLKSVISLVNCNCASILSVRFVIKRVHENCILGVVHGK